MASHYSTRDFFRQMPNALLGRYFNERGLFHDLDLAAMKEGKPDKLFEAWLMLPDARRTELEAELRDIFSLCNEKGVIAILDEARWQMRVAPDRIATFIETLSALPGHFERAMTAYLDHPELWKGASQFYHADTLSYWRKRKNLPRKPAATDAKSTDQLADLIRNYFHHTEGRGKNCVVEPYRRDERDYFFCYPEDHSQRSIEWVNGVFDPRTHNPAFEVIYVYSQKEGSLDLYIRGARKAVEALQGMFAQAILKLDELPPDPKDTRVYDLTPLGKRSFNFNWNIACGIESVVVKKLRLSSLANKGERITLEADTTQDQHAVYNLLDKIGKAVQLHLYNITQVEIAAYVKVDAEKPAKRVTFTITHPNSCSLKYDELDLKLRDMLAASRIEPKEPAEAEAAEPAQA